MTSILLCFRLIYSISVEDLVLNMMHLWCVMLVLPVLVAESLSPGDGCGLNTTVVAGVGPPESQTAEFQYSTSIVSTGERVRECVYLWSCELCAVYWDVHDMTWIYMICNADGPQVIVLPMFA
jgi:hypothetical protein